MDLFGGEFRQAFRISAATVKALQMREVLRTSAHAIGQMTTSRPQDKQQGD